MKERALPGLRAEAASQRLLPAGAAFIRLLPRSGEPVTLAVPRARFDLSLIRPPADAGAPAWSRVPSRDDEDVLEAASLRLPDGSVLQAGTTTAPTEDVLERFRGIVALILLPVVLLAVLGGLLLTRRALAPLRGLIETVRAIEAGSLDTRVKESGTGDELDELGVLFNRMLGQIARLVAGMREAVDDVAHDLRTPLTRLRGGAEVALRAPDDAAALREALADCVEESDAILAMLDGLLDVAEAEAGTMRLRAEPVDLSALAADVVDLYALTAEEKGVRLEAPPAGAPTVRGDRARLRRALANLVDNAVKYSPPGGSVSVSVTRDGDCAAVSVRDDGPGI
ncbi:MAG: HAMP domain-containing protein, partial [Elusimicrobia bacterium]|nr:HAMP domain-containing protein [Elusimicrobiota bacterium]